VKILIGVVVFAGLAVAAVVAIQLWRDDDPELLTAAPTFTPSEPAAAAGSAPITPAGSSVAANVLHFVVDSQQSTAQYVVEETLQGLRTTTVGKSTTGVTGDLYLTRQGLASSPASSFKVDLRTIQSDENRRDDYVSSSTLQTNRFPFAEFVIQSVTGFPANYVEGTQVELTLSGNLTIHGVTRPMTWKVLARQQGGSLGATADTDFKMSDFGIRPPDVGFARADDQLHVQVVLIASQAAS
jgi:polyisoprenoid-binding protein YceI